MTESPRRSKPKLVVGIILTVFGGLGLLGQLASLGRRVSPGLSNPAEALGYVVGMLIIAGVPLVLGILLIVASGRRRASARQPDSTHPDAHVAPGRPEERVSQFMSDYDVQWRTAAPMFDAENTGRPGFTEAFAAWHELMEQIKRQHFTSDSQTKLSGSFGTPPDYGHAVEELVRTEMLGDLAYVVSRCSGPVAKFHEYVLHADGAEWRIFSVAQHFGDPALPYMDHSVVKDRLVECSPTAPVAVMPEEQSGLDETHNFTEREVRRKGDAEGSLTQISEVGILTTSSGVVSVLDFGYENDSARPLTRTVEPGSYPVERITAFGRNAAVRVRFTPQAPVTWHPAARIGGSHVVGVDTGGVCLVDYVGYSTMPRRMKAEVYDRISGAEQPAVIEFAVSATDSGVALDSGYGDGGYPVYWGLDAEGNVAQLVVDFMVLVDEDDDGMLVHL